MQFSEINESNKKVKLNNARLSDTLKRFSLNQNPINIFSQLENKGKNLNIKKNMNFGFVPHFGKGLYNTKNNSNLMLSNILNKEIINKSNITKKLSNTIINKNIKFDFNNQSEDSLENEKVLKKLEKQIKNRIRDMSSTMIGENRTFILNHKKNMEISSIEEEAAKRKRKKKKKKNIEENLDKDRNIVKKRPLYDSLDEEELPGDDDSEGFFINPEGRFIFILDTIVLVSSFYCFLFIPLQIAFSKCFCIEEGIFRKIILFLIDLIFIFDFFVSFFRGFYNYEYKLIKDLKIILKNYLEGSFFIEFLQAIPFNIIIMHLCYNKEKYLPDGTICFFNGINGIYASIKLFSGLKISKVLKAMNRKKNKAYLWLTEIDDHIFEKIFKLLSFTIIALASINIFICLHIFIGYQTFPNWIASMGIQDKSFIQIYIAALYGIIETLTTVGYGDVVCDSFTEIIFQIILLSVGIMAYSWVITIIGNYVNNESKAEIKHSKNLTMLEEIRVEFPKMSFKLYNKIHQHLQSVSHQQKKIDLNILVNSLPYSIKNMVLFKVYHKCIERFIFFKKCDNTDFISRVLTNFIPLFSMKKALLIREGEIVENIFFVKTGKLSLNASLYQNNPEDCIKRYIYEKFEDIMENDNKNPIKQSSKIEKENNNKTINNYNTRKSIQNDKVNSGIQNIQNIFNQKRQSMTNQSYHESRIEQEIGKCDLGGSEDFEEKFGKFLRIMDIKRNENYGTTYMQLNKPSPLSLRVVSKKADIFLLRKHDAINISKAYPIIWKKISEKALKNMIAIKDKTIQTLKNYCCYHGILLDDKIPEKNRKLDPLNLFEIKQLMEIERMKEKEENEQNIKYKSPKSKITKQKTVSQKPLLKSKSLILKKNKIIDNIKKNLFKKYSHETTNLLYIKSLLQLKKSYKENKINWKTTELEEIKEDGPILNCKTKLSTYKFESSLKMKNKIDEPNLILEESQNQSNNLSDSQNLEKTNKIYYDENDKSYPNTLSNLSPAFASFVKTKINKKKVKNKKYYKIMCLKLIDTLNNMIKNKSPQNNINNLKNDMNNKNNNIISNNFNNSLYKNNYYISNSNIILPFSEEINKNKDLISSLSNISQSHYIFNKDKLYINKGTSFEIISVYNNLNFISNGKYEKNKTLQKETEEFVKSYDNNKFTKLINSNLINSSTNKNDKSLSFSFSDDNISEIKSISINEIDCKSKKPIKESSSINNSLVKKCHKNLNTTKSKKSKFFKQNSNIINIKNMIINSNINKDSSLSIYNNSINKLKNSDKKSINNTPKDKRFIQNNKTKSDNFIKKLFQKDKNIKDNSLMKSNEFINDLSILNQDIDLRNNYKREELKAKTFNKMKIDKIKHEEKKNNLNNNGLKTNNNKCIIF